MKSSKLEHAKMIKRAFHALLCAIVGICLTGCESQMKSQIRKNLRSLQERQAALLSDEVAVRFAALVHDLGKATTAKDKLPSHPGHEARSVKLVRRLSERLRVPNECRDLGLIAAEFHSHCHRAFELRASTLLKVLNQTDAFRRPGRFEQFLVSCEADSRGRTGFEDRPYPQADYFRGALSAASGIETGDLTGSGLAGGAIGKAIGERRLAALRDYRAAYKPPK